MNNSYLPNMLVNSKTVPQTQEKSLAQLPFLCLCVFALLRPILNIKYFVDYGILGLNFLELFSIGISYLFIIAFFFNIFRYRSFPLDFVSIVGLLFCLHLMSTIFLGSLIRETSRLVLPFSVFLCIRTTITEKKQITTLLFLAILSYIIPLIGSACLIIQGKSVGKEVYWTGLTRYEGLYVNIHSLAHAMFIFLLIFLMYFALNKNALKGKKLFILFLYFLAILAIFNLFKSYTRNVWIGLFILIIFYIAGRRNYKILAIFLLGAIVVAVTSQKFHTIFFDLIDPLQGKLEFKRMGAGRFGMWAYTIHNFIESPLLVKLMGVGIGKGTGVERIGFSIGRGHNDFLSLLYTTGIIGLFLYLILLFRIAYDILRSNLDRLLKFLFLGFFSAVFFMNMASNSYLTRIELSQFFYLFIGCFYCLDNYSRRRIINQT